MAGVSTAETTLEYKQDSSAAYSELGCVMEIPEVGGTPEKIDTTCLKDTVKKSIPGVKDLGDLAVKCLFEGSAAGDNFAIVQGFENSKAVVSWRIVYPDGTTASFEAMVSVKMDSAAVNNALTFTITMALQSEITWGTASTPVPAGE